MGRPPVLVGSVGLRSTTTPGRVGSYRNEGDGMSDSEAGLWTTDDHMLEAYVFETHLEAGRAADIKSQLISQDGVQFVAQFVGHFSLFARVTAASLGELQERIDGVYRDAGVHSDWSLNLTAGAAAGPKRGSPQFCALVCARATKDPFEVRAALDAGFLNDGEGAGVINAEDFDLLVDLGADTMDELVQRVKDLRAVPGIGRTATSFADLLANDNAVRR